MQLTNEQLSALKRIAHHGSRPVSNYDVQVKPTTLRKLAGDGLLIPDEASGCYWLSRRGAVVVNAGGFVSEAFSRLPLTVDDIKAGDDALIGLTSLHRVGLLSYSLTRFETDALIKMSVVGTGFVPHSLWDKMEVDALQHRGLAVYISDHGREGYHLTGDGEYIAVRMMGVTEDTIQRILNAPEPRPELVAPAVSEIYADGGVDALVAIPAASVHSYYLAWTNLANLYDVNVALPATKNEKAKLAYEQATHWAQVRSFQMAYKFASAESDEAEPQLNFWEMSQPALRKYASERWQLDGWPGAIHKKLLGYVPR